MRNNLKVSSVKQCNHTTKLFMSVADINAMTDVNIFNGPYQNHHGIVERSVRVHGLDVVFDDVVPFHSQVDEALGLGLLSFPIQKVMPCRLILDCCNQPLVRSH